MIYPNVSLQKVVCKFYYALEFCLNSSPFGLLDSLRIGVAVDSSTKSSAAKTLDSPGRFRHDLGDPGERWGCWLEFMGLVGGFGGEAQYVLIYLDYIFRHIFPAPLATGRGWREPGNMILQRGRIFGLVLFKIRVTDQGVGPAWQRQSGAGAG